MNTNAASCYEYIVRATTVKEIGTHWQWEFWHAFTMNASPFLNPELELGIKHKQHEDCQTEDADSYSRRQMISKDILDDKMRFW